MFDKPDYYDAEELRILVAEPYLHVLSAEAEKELEPSPKHRAFLLALVRKYPEGVSYQELWKDVWRRKTEMTEDDRAKIQTTKGQLVEWLKANDIKSLIIEPQPGIGYRLKNEVFSGYYDDSEEENPGKTITEPETWEKVDTEIELVQIDPELKPIAAITDKQLEEDKIDNWKELLFSNSFYLSSAAIAYGILFPITAFMEIAYEFDAYSGKLVFGGAILMLINIAAVFAASGVTSYRLFAGKAGLLAGAVVLFAASLFSILISGYYLPVQPVTKAGLQTQPALIAYWKNVMLYYFPLGLAFILLPFYTVSAKHLLKMQMINKVPSDHIFIKPKRLLNICVFLLICSLGATFYLLDHLNSESPRYPLYTALILLRLFIWHCVAFGSLAWFYAKTRKQENL